MATTPTATRPAIEDGTSSAKPTGAKPVATFRFGAISAAIFAEPWTKPDGSSGTAYNVSVRRSFQTAEGKWVHSHTLGMQDLLTAAFLLTKCADFVAGVPKAASKD